MGRWHPPPWTTAWTLVWLATAWLCAPAPGTGYDEELNALVQTWFQHPHLVPSSRVEQTMPASVRRRVDALRSGVSAPAPYSMYLAQVDFDRRARRFVKQTESSVRAQLSPIPSLGLRQVSWLTGGLVPLGVWALLGVLPFFWVAGVPLEQRVPRAYGGLIFLGGAAGCAMAAAFDGTSMRPVAGAAAAVSALVGAQSLPRWREALIQHRWSPRWGHVAGAWVLGLGCAPWVSSLPGSWGWGQLAVFGAAGFAASLWEIRSVYETGRSRVEADRRFGALAGACMGLMGLGGGGFAPQAPMPDETGVLHVTSDPPGARVRLDHTTAPEPTPTRVEGLRTGRVYRVEVEQGGRLVEPKVRFVRVAPEPVSVSFKTFPKVMLRVESVPEAMVWLDGRRLGVTPRSLPPLPAGKERRLELTAAGYVPQTRRLVPQESGPIQIELEPGLPMAVRSTPDPAQVYVDGQYAGPTPLDELWVPSTRRFELRVERAGYRPFVLKPRPGRLRPGQELSVRLKEIPLTQMELTFEQRAELEELRSALRQTRQRVAGLRSRLRQARRKFDRARGFNAQMEAERRVEMAQSDLEEAQAEREFLLQQIEVLDGEVRDRLPSSVPVP